MKHHHQTRRTNQRRSSRRQKTGSETHRGTLTLITAIFGGLLLFTLSILYVGQINQVATGGLTIQGLTEQIADLKIEIEQLEFEVTDLRSLSTIERSSGQLDLVTRAPAIHLPPASASVAVAP